MGENEIDRILADIVAGENISVEDRELLENWKQSSGENRCLAKEVQELACTGTDLKTRRNRGLVFDRIEQIVRKRRNTRFIWKLSVAASVVLIIGMTVYFMFLPRPEKGASLQMATGIVPGAPRAELVLPQGKVIQLDTTTRVVPVSNGMTQVMSCQNTLIYDSEGEGEQVEYHMIRVPRGGEYNLQLADNTKVYLNAGSSLRYPVRFTGNRREVELIGEGYFEVARDTARPFIVKAGTIDVQVLGTEFNVNAYPDEEIVATTLVKGSVRVNYGAKQQVMQPGTRLVYDKDNGNAEVHTVDTEVYTSWKDGYYYFKRETLENIMDVLIRWYDLNVFYQNTDLKDLEFGGRLKRYEDINYLLKRMEETQDIEFIINGKTITIKRKTD